MIWCMVTGHRPNDFIEDWASAISIAIDNSAFTASVIDPVHGCAGFVIHPADDGLAAPYPGRGVVRLPDCNVVLPGLEPSIDVAAVLKREALSSLILRGQFSAIIPFDDHFLAINDFYGAEPIYFADIGRGWIISSDVRAILAAPGFSIQVNSAYVTAKVHVSNIGSDADLPDTPAYLGLAKLMPGKRARFPLDGGPPQIIDLGVDLSSVSPFKGDFKDAVTEFESILRRVMEGVRAFSPKLTADLSGGIDSGLLAACASELFPTGTLNLSTMIAGNYDSYLMNDGLLVEQFKNFNDLEGVQIDVAKSMEISRHYPPFLGVRSIANYGYLVEAYRYARESGSSGRLTGEGGDYHLLGTDMVGDCGRDTWRGSRAQFGLLGLDDRAPQVTRMIALAARRYIPSFRDRLYRQALWSENEFSTLKFLYNSRPEEIETLQSAVTSKTKRMPWFRRFQYDMLYPRASYMDEFAHFPVPHFAPYLDIEVIRFAFSLPADFLIDVERHNSANDYAWSKRLLRASFSATLPAEMANKRLKTDYNDMTVSHIRDSFDEMYAELLSVLAHSSVTSIFDKNRVMSLARRTGALANLPGSSFGTDAILLLSLVDLGSWLRAVEKPKDQFLHSAFSNYRP